VIFSSIRWLELVVLLAWTIGSAALGQPIQPHFDIRDQSPQKLYERFEADYKKALADPTYDVVRMHNDLAWYLSAATMFGGKPDLAIEICESFLARDRARGDFGEMHSAYTIGQLVRLYQKAEKHDRAVVLLDEYVKWATEEYGEKNLYTLDITSRLAEALGKARRYDRACTLYQSVIAHYPDADQRKSTLLVKLMDLYKDAGQVDKELATGQAILDLAEKVRGKGASSKYLALRAQLARRCFDGGKKDLALKLLEGDLEEARKTNGADHPTTLDLLGEVAGRYFALERPEKGLAFLTEAVDLYKKKLGPDHEATLLASTRLAQGYEGVGKLDEAIEHYAAALPKLKTRLGVEHQQVLAATLALALAYESKKKPGQAEAWWRDYLEGQRKATGAADSSPALQAQAMLGWNLLKQEKWTEAEKTLRECWEGRRKKEPHSWSTFNSASQIGGALLGQKKYREAEPFLVEGYEGMKQREAFMPLPARPRLTEALERLVQLYEATNRKDRADELRKQLPKKQP
jgi:non-specific serine/threonine protein kinase/serine/threonine-protein kinase